MTAYRPNCRRIPELNGLRVLLVFIVSWYHFWQQSWLTPSIGRYSLDYLLRAGYMPVDGTILLSGFLLFLPYARTMMLGERVPDTKAFYQRRIMRIVPSYYFLTLLMLFAVAIPYNLYGRTSEAVRDVLMHLTFTQTFNYATYIATPIGVASWTIAIEMQAYLIFPLLAKGTMKNPLGTLMSMAAVAFAFRGWCLWRLDEYNMVVNQLANFLDVYAMGMGASILYVRLTQLYPAESRRKWLWQGAATRLFLRDAPRHPRTGVHVRTSCHAGRADDAPSTALPDDCGADALAPLRRAPPALPDGQPRHGLACCHLDELLPAASEPCCPPEAAAHSAVREQ